MQNKSLTFEGSVTRNELYVRYGKHGLRLYKKNMLIALKSGSIGDCNTVNMSVVLCHNFIMLHYTHCIIYTLYFFISIGSNVTIFLFFFFLQSFT